MILTRFHLGLRQVVMALMIWAIDVLRKLLQSDAIPFHVNFYILFKLNFYYYSKKGNIGGANH